MGEIALEVGVAMVVTAQTAKTVIEAAMEEKEGMELSEGMAGMEVALVEMVEMEE
ncbi:MAG: hypothetical protein K0S07_1338 [Chlamydiales bacterium]|jgi:hypothetical protein|nr:hypothetical protein [Chlamydiales bacterium]